jgi:hypothetical protein
MGEHAADSRIRSILGSVSTRSIKTNPKPKPKTARNPRSEDNADIRYWEQHKHEKQVPLAEVMRKAGYAVERKVS